MNRPVYRPKRRLRHELLPVALLAASVLALAWIFPNEALRFVPVRRAPLSTACAWVTLTAAEEKAALEASRAAWRVDGARQRSRLRVFAQPLPEPAYGAVFGLSDRPHATLPSVPPYRVETRPASVAAPAPAVLPSDAGDAAVRPFPHRELLDTLRRMSP